MLLTETTFSQISKSSLLKSTVVMQVFDFNRFSKHNIIGELRLLLCNVDWNHVIEEWQDLAEPAKFEVFFAVFSQLVSRRELLCLDHPSNQLLFSEITLKTNKVV